MRISELLTKTILLIDDDDDDREMFENALNNIDNTFQFVGLSKAEEALDLLSNKLIAAPDIIFLDLNMPRMSGKDFLHEFSKLGMFHYVPVVIFSTTPRSEELSVFHISGYLTKPSRFSDMEEPLRKILMQILTEEAFTACEDKKA